MLSVSELGNYELCHDPQGQNIYPFQSAQQGPHLVQPKIHQSIDLAIMFTEDTKLC